MPVVTGDHLPRPGEDVLSRLVALPVDSLAGLGPDTVEAMLPARLRADLRRFVAETWDALDGLGSLGRLGDLAALAHPAAGVLTDPNVLDALADLPVDKLAALADRAAAGLADLPAAVPATLTALSAEVAIDLANLSVRMASREAERTAGRDGGWAQLGFEQKTRAAETLAALPADKREILRRLSILPAAGLGEWGSTPAEAARCLGALTDADVSVLNRLAMLDATELTVLRMLGRRGHAARLEILARVGTLPADTLAGLHRLGVLDADTVSFLCNPFVTSYSGNGLAAVYAIADLAGVSDADLRTVSELTMRAGTPGALPDAGMLRALWLLGGVGEDVLHHLSQLSATETLAVLSVDDPTALSAADRSDLPAGDLAGLDPAGSAFQLAVLRRLHVHRGGLEEDTMERLDRFGRLGEDTLRTLIFLANVGALDPWGAVNNALDQGGLPDDVRAELIARAEATLAAGQYFTHLTTVWGGIRPLAVMSALLSRDGGQ